MITTQFINAIDHDYADPLTMEAHLVVEAIEFIWEGLKKLLLLRDPKWVGSLTNEDAEDALAEECIDTAQDKDSVRSPCMPVAATQPSVVGGSTAQPTRQPEVSTDTSLIPYTAPTRVPPSTYQERFPVQEEEEEDPRPGIAATNRVAAAINRHTSAMLAMADAATSRDSAAAKATEAADAAFQRDTAPVSVERHRRVKHKEPFIRALVEEVKCKLGRPTRSPANTLVVRRILHNRCVELKVRPRDSQRAIAIAMELVFTPDEAEVDAAVLRNSWAVRVRKAKLWYANTSATFRYVCPKSLGIWGGALLGVNLSNEVA